MGVCVPVVVSENNRLSELGHYTIYCNNSHQLTSNGEFIC